MHWMKKLLLGDEAVAAAAVDAGIGAAYGYPGTPSTEILQSIIDMAEEAHGYVAQWCSNEKTAYEQALGACMVGRRAIVTMKHVGLNVAADPFMNSTLLDLKAGLVLAVADDPGMHSSQNEQDSRFYADFARTVCLEPGDQQEAYDMTRDAFDLSERLGRPVVLRLVTRLAHSRSIVKRRPAEHPRPAVEQSDAAGWTLVPANSREQWRKVVESRPAVLGDEAARRYNIVEHANSDADYAVVTAGIGRNYFLEHVDRLSFRPSHLHIGYHPFDPRLLESMPKGIKRIIVFEDGYPVVERELKGMVTNGAEIEGRRTGLLPATGELTPDNVEAALKLDSPPSRVSTMTLPGRPPQLCQGCPHADSFTMIRTVLDDQSSGVVTSDIGCYALGGLAPEVVTDSIVCMGASIGMAKGAAEAGHRNVVATIGDSTFLHSGIPGLVDAVQANTPMTLLILDNSIVAMTGGQPSATTSERLEAIVRGVGVSPEHIVTLRPIRTEADENAEALRREMAYQGLSVVIARRDCVKFKPMKEKKAG